MKTTLELAARALCELDSHSEDAMLSGKPLWMAYLPEARAVLAAIREPSRAVPLSGANSIGMETGHLIDEGDMAGAWRAMIDAALSEHP